MRIAAVFRRALHIRPAVDEHDAMLARREDRRESRAADAADALDRERGPGEQRARASGGDDRVARAVLEEIQRHRH